MTRWVKAPLIGILVITESALYHSGTEPSEKLVPYTSIQVGIAVTNIQFNIERTLEGSLLQNIREWQTYERGKWRVKWGFHSLYEKLLDQTRELIPDGIYTVCHERESNNAHLLIGKMENEYIVFHL